MITREQATRAIWDQWNDKDLNRVQRAEYRPAMRQIVRDYRSGDDPMGCLQRLVDLPAPSFVKVRALRRMGGVIIRTRNITAKVGMEGC